MTILYRFLISIVNELYDDLYGVEIFTKLNLQLDIIKLGSIRKIYKMAFQTQEGHYEFLVMTFTINALATFQALINMIFFKLLHKFVLILFDNILMYNQTKQSHEQHLFQVFEILVFINYIAT